MLAKFKEKITKCQLFKKVKINLDTPTDVRDFRPNSGKYDVLMSHWVFHLISDWKLALISLERCLSRKGLVVVLEETSSLYDAIDQNLETTPNGTAMDFWKAYHGKRRETIGSITGTPAVVPRYRLGSMVVDERVEHLFRVLGWHPKESMNHPVDSWTVRMTIKDILDNIIKKRAFSNMRTSSYENSRKVSSKISTLLEEEFRNNLGVQLKIDCKLKGKVLCFDETKALPKRAGTLLLYVARDSVGSRWKREIDFTYNKEKLWTRLIENFWIKLNENDGLKGPFRGTGFEVADMISGLLVSAFWKSETRGKPAIKVIASQEKDFWEGESKRCWNEIISQSEVREPIHIAFSCDNKDSCSAFDESNFHFHLIPISKEAKSKLASLHDEINFLTDDISNIDDIMSDVEKASQEDDLSFLLKRAKNIGLLPLENRRADAKFIIGLSRMAKTNETEHFYFLPYYDDYFVSPIGLIFGGKEPVTFEFIEFITTLSLLLFQEYIESCFKERKENTEIVRILPTGEKLWGASTSKGVILNNPYIVLLTSADVEWVTAMKILESHGEMTGESSITLNFSFPKLNVVIAKSSIGSNSEGGSQEKVGELITKYNPKAIIALGIACGMQAQKQFFGDILISKQIWDYSSIRRETEGVKYRGFKENVPADFLNSFIQLAKGILPPAGGGGGNTPNCIDGLIASGPELVDKKERIVELLDNEPEAIGLEMEGVGLHVACARSNTPHLIVKSISDFGFKKHKDFQSVACENAFELVLRVISQEAFQDYINQKA